MMSSKSGSTSASSTDLMLAFTVSMLIPLEDLFLYHAMDRKLYTILTFNLFREPVECKQVMALWIWLENNSLYSIIDKILTLPHVLINELADEALVCLNHIYNAPSLFAVDAATEIPLTQRFTKKEITLKYFTQNRDLAIRELKKVDTDVCSKVFTDIMNKCIIRNNQILFQQTQQMLVQGLGQLTLSNNNNNIININNNNNDNGNGNGNGNDGNNNNQEVRLPAEERAMFVTFSKGYPVAEHEVREFFIRRCGDCIESLYMQDVRGNDEQPLFAKVVFYRLRTIQRILNGEHKAKFTINGKHVWVRKFVPKTRLSPSIVNEQPNAVVVPEQITLLTRA